MKKILRSIQTLFPFLHDFRFKVKFWMMSVRHVPHEHDFEAMKLFHAGVDKVFVDIGSNRGESILSMLLMNQTATHIVGFEPNPFIFDKLKSEFHKKKNIVVYNMGLANENKECPLYIPFYRNWMFDGLASFKYLSAKNWLKTRMWQYDESKLSVKEVNCQIRKLDDFHLKPYFIKIDVQGLELEVLKGGVETVKTYAPIILLESINEEIIQFLEPFRYRFFHFVKGRFLEGQGILNTFCIHQDRMSELKMPEKKRSLQHA